MKTKVDKWNRVVTKVFTVLFLMCILTFIFSTPIHATAVDEIGGSGIISDNADNFNLNINSNAGSASMSTTLQILLVLTVLSIAPSILIMLTSFTRITIVLHFVRSALGTQTTPPNQILIGLALFLTFFTMAPVFSQINTNAIEPLSRGEITQEVAIEEALDPLRTFMYNQTNRKDLKLFINIANIPSEDINDENDIPTTVLIPSFIISELRTSFIMGFVIYIPFIVIDMVVASTLMSMGMMMLPPTMISMPFKLLLFVLADGWNLVIGEVVQTFKGIY